jgi:hypothetical protein
LIGFSLRGNPQKSAANIFLNCTKNTELTQRPFARTFILALSIKKRNQLGPDSTRYEMNRRVIVSIRRQSSFTIERKIRPGQRS